MSTDLKKLFRFKRFAVAHTESSMKVGVDGVLIGLWVDVSPAAGAITDGNKPSVDILDVGTGCGIVALVCAQRQPKARVLALDVDAGSVGEASSNFTVSPWADRLECSECDFVEFAETSDRKFDLIVSNPPYFSSGVISPDSRRLAARHQGRLSPSSLLAKGRALLKPGGRIAMVLPTEQAADLSAYAAGLGLRTVRATTVFGNPRVASKRTLMEFAEGSCDTTPLTDSLIIEEAPGVYTQEYIALGHDFYLKF